MYFTINGIDFSDYVSNLRPGFEVLVADNSGRNAQGDTVIDILNRKTKLYVTFRHTTQEEMNKLLSAIEDYVVTVGFLNPKTKALSTISAYIGTPEPEYYTIQAHTVIFKPMNLNFIEL